MSTCTPTTRALLEQNPAMRETLTSPAFLQSMSNPENLRAMMQMQQVRGENWADTYPWGCANLIHEYVFNLINGISNWNAYNFFPLSSWNTFLIKLEHPPGYYFSDACGKAFTEEMWVFGGREREGEKEKEVSCPVPVSRR